MQISKDHLQLVKFETFYLYHICARGKELVTENWKKYEQNKPKKYCSFIQLGSKRMVCMIQKILRMFVF